MLNEKELFMIAYHLDIPVKKMLEENKQHIFFLPSINDRSIGFVIKESEFSSIQLNDVIQVEDANYIELEKGMFGVIKVSKNIKLILRGYSNKEKTVKELTNKNLLTAIKIVTEIMEADLGMAMDQIMAINEKVKVAAKLKENGYETKEQRKEVHNAIRYYKSKIKSLGVVGAAEDTAEKYRYEPKFIKYIVGFQNKQRQNRFK